VTERSRRWVRAVALLGASSLTACGGGHHGGGRPAAPAMTCGGTTAAAADLIRFDCPGSAGSPMAVRVMIGGPTTSTDIYLVKFDVVFDPAVVEFAPPAMQGDFLDQDGNGTLVEAAPASNDPGRLVVSVTRTGSGGGVGVAAGEKTVVTLPFMGMATGSTTLAFDNAETRDSTNTLSANIQFSGPVNVTSP
jgi:hypothetical protein